MIRVSVLYPRTEGAAFTPHAREIMADVANYTTIRPMVQTARVRTLTP